MTESYVQRYVRFQLYMCVSVWPLCAGVRQSLFWSMQGGGAATWYAHVWIRQWIQYSLTYAMISRHRISNVLAIGSINTVLFKCSVSAFSFDAELHEVVVYVLALKQHLQSIMLNTDDPMPQRLNQICRFFLTAKTLTAYSFGTHCIIIIIATCNNKVTQSSTERYHRKLLGSRL